MRRLILPLVGAVALFAAGCGGDDEGNFTTADIPSANVTVTAAATTETTDTSTTDTQASATTPEGTEDPSQATKPEIEVPTDPAPKELVVNDLVEGEGAEAKAGDTLTVDYVGVLYKDGKEFDSSWDSGQPFTFELGSGGVIQGWDQGLEGMKVGGRRELTIPANLAYGTEGAPPDIPGNSALIFVVDLKEIGS